MKYRISKSLSAPEFKRLFGIQRETFEQMTELMKQAAQSKGQGGVKFEVNLALSKRPIARS